MNNSIVIYIFAILSVIISTISIKVYKTYKNPCIMMNAIWLVCICFSALQLYDLYPVSKHTYEIILLFAVIFSIVCMLTHYFLYNKRSVTTIYSDLSEDNNNVWILIWFVIGIIIIVMIKPLLNNVKYLLAGTIRKAHNDFFGYHGGMTFFQYFAYGYIFSSFLKATVILCIYYFFIGKKNRLTLGLIGSTCIIINLLINGGRNSVFECIIYFIMAFLFCTNKETISVNKKKHNVRNTIFISLFVAVGINILSIMTKDSATLGNDVLTTFYVYLVGSISYLDIILKNKSMFGICRGEYLYGKGTFGLISIPFDILRRLIFRTEYLGADRMHSLYTERFFLISPRIRYNAACTIIYTFLRDWGDVGIVIGTVIYAIFVSVTYYNYIQKRNARWTCLWLYVAYSIFFSFWRYNFAQSNVMIFVWLYFFTSKIWYRHKIRIKINKTHAITVTK